MALNEVQVPHGGLNPLMAEVVFDSVNVDAVGQPLSGSEVPKIVEAFDPIQTSVLLGNGKTLSGIF